MHRNYKFIWVGSATVLLTIFCPAVPGMASEIERAIAELNSKASAAAVEASQSYGPDATTDSPYPLGGEGFETGTGDLLRDTIYSETLDRPLNEGVADIFAGGDYGGGFESGTSGIPGEVWEVIQSQTGIAVEDASVETIWNDITGEYNLPSYESIFGGGNGSGGSSGSIVSYFAPDPSSNPLPLPSSGSSTPPIAGGSTIPTSGNGLPPIFSGGLPTTSGGSTPTTGSSGGGNGPFAWIRNWYQKKIAEPLMQAFGREGARKRDAFRNKAVGVLTKNSVVKRRDQANLLSQELARTMAAPRLGAEGREWMENEAARTTAILTLGTHEANSVVKLAADAQAMTSTQDVAKAVADIGGQNANLILTSMQLQGQNQDALAQLQQLLSASIELEANISEAMDENNRRERLERNITFSNSAQETLYLRGVWSNGNLGTP